MRVLHSFFFQITLVFLLLAALTALWYASRSQQQTVFVTATSTTQAATVVQAATSTPAEPLPSIEVEATSTKPALTTVKKASIKAKNAVSVPSSTPPEITRIQNPYTTPPLSFDTINTMAHGALVNILCMPKGGSLRPISGSGTIIDQRGIILTNAHVAQYVLLSQSEQINLNCVVRTGSPAQAHWIPRVLYIPAPWVEQHAADITSSHATGTGELDYALLYIDSGVDGSVKPSSFPYLPFDPREAIGFVEDPVLTASYPAEFLGGISTQSSLYLSSSIAKIQQLMTFHAQTVDVLSLGGVIQAQAGSSGGAVVNAWGKLIGVITTTSEGATTAERDLRAISVGYINRDIAAQTGLDLTGLLSLNPSDAANDFASHEAPALTQLLIKQILK